MRILVTGGAGFIGSILVPQLLSHGHYVTVLDSLIYGVGGLPSFYGDPGFRFVKGDILTSSSVWDALEGVDAVVHLAALRLGHCSRLPDLASAVNVGGTGILVEAAAKRGVRHFVLASSCSVYGSIPAGEAASEETSPNALSPYADTKVGAEGVVKEAARDSKMLVTILRFASAYGVSANMRFDLLPNGLALDATGGGLEVWGKDERRALVHVWDTASAVARCIAFGRLWQGTINVGGHNRCKRDLADSLKSQNPVLEVSYVDSPPGTRDYSVDFSKVQALGFLPEYTPEEGLYEVTEAVRLGIVTASKGVIK